MFTRLATLPTNAATRTTLERFRQVLSYFVFVTNSGEIRVTTLGSELVDTRYFPETCRNKWAHPVENPGPGFTVLTRSNHNEAQRSTQSKANRRKANQSEAKQTKAKQSQDMQNQSKATLRNATTHRRANQQRRAVQSKARQRDKQSSIYLQTKDCRGTSHKTQTVL
jgi:hypothetical protein